ncbi:MAG: hypothetical protein ABL962_14135 [Fimbriimonadaceae bacterium]
MAGTWLPLREADRAVWARNFLTKLSSYQAVLSLTPADVTAITNDLNAYIYMITVSYMVKVKTQEVHAYKRLLIHGKGGTAGFPANLILPAAPTAVNAGVIRRLSRLVARIKAAEAYTNSIGEDLGIVPVSYRPDEDNAKPRADVKALPNSEVQIKWRKGRFWGVVLESRRGDESEWTVLSKDFTSPYSDLRPPLVEGKPEVRSYRLRYLKGDVAVGGYSDEIIVSTNP